MLALVRHGESAWNAADRFAGRIDVALTARGRQQARTAGLRLRAQGISPTVVHTSRLARAMNTADIILDASGTSPVRVLRTALLNERHYGALQGLRRGEAIEAFGGAQVARWRRGIDDRPPADQLGRSESLADVRVRVREYVSDHLFPDLGGGHTVLVVSHGNTLRMLVQALEGLCDEEASALEVPTGGVRIYGQVSDLLQVG